MAFPTPNVPVDNNPGQWPKTPVLNPPSGITLHGPTPRKHAPSLGTPMDAAPTCPAVSRNPPQGSPN